MADARSITQVLEALSPSDPSTVEALMPLVYDELRIMARRQMAMERASHTLQPTALVHEAFVRLIENASST